jgi:hypothetical protein
MGIIALEMTIFTPYTFKIFMAAPRISLEIKVGKHFGLQQ